MKVDHALIADWHKIPNAARDLEVAGYDALMTAETAHDPFFPLLLAAEHTECIELMTSIAVAFARSPMVLANLAHDLNSYSKGRLILGLGSQIQPHITKRFSMPWSSPAARMRELVQAIRAIWACWYEGERLRFEGEFYRHTLMTPMFTPTDTQYGVPRLFLAAVGPLMTEVAAEVCDGLIAHAFTTDKYVREVTLPAVERGLNKAGKSRVDFEISCPVFVVAGENEREYAEARTAVTRQIAFYGSTPAYRPVLELHGWGSLQNELNVMSKQGQWAEMGELVDDEMLETIAIVGEPKQIAGKLKDRYGDLLDRITCSFRLGSHEQQRQVIDELKSS